MEKIVSALKKTGDLIASNHLRQKIFLICILALFAFIYVKVFAPPTTQVVPVYNDASPRAVHTITGNSPIALPLHMTGGNPIGVTLDFEQPKYSSADLYTIDILDASGKAIYENKVSANSLSTNKNQITCGLINMPKAGGEYTLTITGKNYPDDTAISIYTRQLENEVVPEAAITYSRGISPNVYKFSFIVVLAGCILILFYSKKIHVNILATILVFGVLFALFTPIMDVPDEAQHAGKAFMIAGGTFFNPPGGGMVPSSVIQVTGLSQYGQTIVNTTLQGAALNPGVVQSTFGAAQFFLGYIPAALVILVCQFLHTNVLTLLYGGRIINLVVYALCAFFAIKIAPRYKIFFGVIAVAPIALFIAASYNGDYLTYGLAILLAAMFTRFYFQKDFKITYKQIIWFSIVCAIICMIKYNLLPLCLVLLIIPASRFASKKVRLISILIAIAIPVIAAVGIFAFQQYQFAQFGGTSAVVGTDLNMMGANVSQQIHFILSNVTSASAILIRAFVTNTSGYINQLFTFGWLTYSVPTIFVYLYVAFIALVGIVYSKYEYKADSIVETKHTLINKAGILILLLLTFVAINLLLYLDWDPVGSNIITGVQGRYFIPLLLFLPFLSSNSRPQTDESSFLKKQNYILFAAQGFIILSIIQTLFTYY